MIDTKEQLHQRLKDIKTQLRLSMNGVVSQSMREKGLVYKLNIGGTFTAGREFPARDSRYLGGRYP